MEKRNGKWVVWGMLTIVALLSMFAVYVGNVTREVQMAEKKAAAEAAAAKEAGSVVAEPSAEAGY